MGQPPSGAVFAQCVPSHPTLVFPRIHRTGSPLRWGKEERFIDMMLALHHAADRKRASHLPNTPEALGFLPFPSCPWACTRARQAPSWAHGLPPNTETAGRSVDMAQSKKSVLSNLGISCGIMASQATRITAYNIGRNWREKI